MLPAGPPPLPLPPPLSHRSKGTNSGLLLKVQSPGFNQSSEGDACRKGSSPLIQPTSATLAAACRAVYYQQTAHPGLEYSTAETAGAGRWVRNRGERRRGRNANERRLSSPLLSPSRLSSTRFFICSSGAALALQKPTPSSRPQVHYVSAACSL